MKKIMVLGAGFPQVRLLAASGQLGYRTVVCSIPGDYPGFQQADEIAYADISNPQEVLNAAVRYAVDGIATCCLDTGIRALGYACEKLGFTGLSAHAADCSADKWLMKQAFLHAGVNTARCYRVTCKEVLEEAVDKLGLPVVLKAVDLQGSKGIYICRTKAEAMKKYEEVLKLTRQKFCIVEEYIDGYELGAQAFIYHGEIVFVLPHGDDTYQGYTAIPIGHYIPIDSSARVTASVIEESEKAIRAVGLDNCAVNIDLIERGGKVYVVEVTGRAGATCLPESVSIYYGVDYYKMIAAMAVGDDPLVLFHARNGGNTANASRMLLSEQTGTVKDIVCPVVMDEEICELSLNVKKGDLVHKFMSAKDRIGQVVVKGHSYESCKQKLDTVCGQIRLELE